MNKNQGPLKTFQNTPQMGNAAPDKSYTLAEAGTLANREQNRGNFQAAVAIYDRILEKLPQHAFTHFNRGLALQSMGRLGDALASYDQAIAQQPDYAEAYNNRSVILYAMKRYDEAAATCERALVFKPNDALLHNNRGNALHALLRHDDALASYDKAVALRSDYAEAYSNRSVLLEQANRFDEALASCDKAVAIKPDFATAHNNRGNVLQGLKRFEEAVESYDKAIALMPNNAEPYRNRGNALARRGDMPEAERMFRKSLALQSDLSDAWLDLTNIHKYEDVGHPDLKHIQSLLGKPDISLHDKENLSFALGKIYDDCKRYDEAFEFYRQGNEILSSIFSYKAHAVTEITTRIIEVFNKDFLAGPFASASESRLPVFVVGMPRSGTTLMASILSNHPSIATAGELPTLNEFASRLPKLIGNEVAYPEASKLIKSALATSLVEEYEKRLRRDAGAEVAHVVDKHPLNFRHLGLIAMLFPQAQVIHCTRHPLDTGLSNYFQRFSSNYAYSSDLRNIGHFYLEYRRLMDHWREALPLKMIEISYEEMILNTERTTRQVLDWLGLEWDERCLAPHTNPSPVETASQWQVRQPIYTQSVERWRHYEKHLGPLIDIVQPYLGPDMP